MRQAGDDHVAVQPHGDDSYIWPKRFIDLLRRAQARFKIPMGNTSDKLLGNEFTRDRVEPIADALKGRYLGSDEVRAGLVVGGAIIGTWFCRIEVNTGTEYRFNQLKEEIMQVIWEVPMVKRECASPRDIVDKFAVRVVRIAHRPSVLGDCLATCCGHGTDAPYESNSILQSSAV